MLGVSTLRGLNLELSMGRVRGMREELCSR